MYPQYIDGAAIKKDYRPTKRQRERDEKKAVVCQCGRAADFDGEYCKLCIKADIKKQKAES